MKPATRLGAGGAHSPAEREVAHLLKRLPNVEPTDVEMQRVWRNLEAPTPTHRWRRVLLAGSLVTAIAVIAVGVWRERTSVPTPAMAKLQMTSGDVSIARSHDLGPAPSGREIQAGDRLHTEAGAALLSLGSVGAVLLSSSSEMEVEQLFPGTWLNLTSGTVTARVSKRSPDHPFVVQTPRFRVAVVGTVFAVAARPDGEVVVSVNEGTVEVTAPGRVQRVSAGTSWHSDSGAIAPSELPLSAAALLEASTEHSGDLAKLFQALSAEPRAVPASSAGATPSAPVLPPAPSLVPRHPRPPPRLAVAPPSAVAPTVAPPVAPLPSPPAQSDPYEQAVHLMAGGQNEQAAQLLEQGSAPGTSSSGMALYELGRLRQQRLNDPVGALAAFRRYREEFPTGPLRPEVDLSMLQIALSQGNSSDALQQSTEFLAANPGSERADEVRLIRGNLFRERGDCVKALEDYRQIQKPAYAEDVLYFSAACHRTLGRDQETRKELQEYLRKYPTGRYAEAAQHTLGGGR